MKKAIYVGTFDPITNGHLDIIRRATALFDHLVIGVSQNERKSPCFDLARRVEMVNAAVADIDSVSVCEYTGLTIDFLKIHDAQFMIRGLRSRKDFDYEFELAEINRDLSAAQAETVFLMAQRDYAHVSSSVVRELIAVNAFDQVSSFVPEAVLPFIQ